MPLPFQGLCDTTLTDLESSSQSLSCAKNTILLTADTPWRKVYWLHSGTVRMYYLGVPAHHIASYLGITPVSLSRLKKSLEINI